MFLLNKTDYNSLWEAEGYSDVFWGTLILFYGLNYFYKQYTGQAIPQRSSQLKT